MPLAPRSEQHLAEVHPDLVRVVRAAAARTPATLLVYEGARTIEEQRAALARGVTKTLNSRHIPSGSPPVSHAVDMGPLVAGRLPWSDRAPWIDTARVMKDAARTLGIPITSGALDWPRFFDGPHHELDRRSYP